MQLANYCKNLLTIDSQFGKCKEADKLKRSSDWNSALEELKAQFTMLLFDVERDGIKELVKYLVDSSFFSDPASARYHNAFPGGLLDHSMNVFYELTEMAKLYNFSFSIDSMVIIALLHDLCKIGNYKTQVAWRKDINNKWESYNGYGFNNDEFPAGHGEKSVFIISEFIKLTKEEILAIRWHSGAFEQGVSIPFTNACKLSPLVTLTHSADLHASMILEPQGTMEWLIEL